MASAPQYPDPAKTAGTQAQFNKDAAIAQTNLGHTNQITPFGNQTWAVTGKNADGTPQYTATTTLAPGQQELLNQNTQLSGQALNAAGDQLRNLPAQGTAPTYQGYTAGPNLQNSVQGAGNIQRNVAQGSIHNTIASAGPLQNRIAGAGAIERNLSTDDYGAQRQQVEDALMGRLNDDYQRDYARREQDLANRGIRVGSEAYNASMADYGRSLAEARTSATLGAGQEQNRLQQLDLNARNFANTAQAQQFGQNSAQQQAFNAAQGQQYNQNANNAAFYNQAQNQNFNQDLANAGLNNAGQQQQFGQNQANAVLNNQSLQQEWQNRNTATAGNNQNLTQGFNNQNTLNTNGINNFNALRGGSQITPPSFMMGGGAGVAPVDYTGQVNGQYNAQLQNYNNNWNAIGMGANMATGWMVSDAFAKEDIDRIGQTDDGLPLYSWRYKEEVGGPNAPLQIGPMAQDVQRRNPDAVRRTPSGFLAINVPEAFKRAA